MTTAALVSTHALTAAEREAFKRDGYFLIENALSPADVARFAAVADRIADGYRKEQGQPPTARVNIHDTIGRDEEALELIDWPTTFRRVWELMGWNIHLYHTQLIVTPPQGADLPVGPLGWHQDNNRMNKDIVDVELQPMISLKCVYFLTDVTEANRGNFCVVPGSHVRRSLEYPPETAPHPKGMTPVRARAGTAVIFDRRLWHAADENRSDLTRKVLFYGYGFRWLRPKCDMRTAHLIDRCDPVRRQLLGVMPEGHGGCYDPKPADVPLRDLIAREAGPDAVAR